VILDFSHVYYGPYATMIMADLGAEVIKVEPVWGEVAREYDPKFGGVSQVFSEELARYSTTLTGTRRE